MTNENFFYNFFYMLLSAAVKVQYKVCFSGLENLPAGGAVICANHTSWIDPFFIGIALTKKDKLFMMAKEELFQNGLISFVLLSLGAFPVNRNKPDVGAIRTAIRHLRAGHKVGIFPEGTRVSENEVANAKGGAVRIALKTGVPIIPVYIPRRKRLFSSVLVRFGKPYRPSKRMASKKEADEAVSELMEKIRVLGIAAD